ncbi:SGNH/GDSL hydrolase family protein [Variovorax sp.]|uniref:SGNH/GDSL hydrolase family protein n=1 Tax=Variovorax sp. TaxID=1871043 RepID=UPI002D72D588|nr:SGNH/GDSL hydrolase family protein [Variovorax sp.]HYP83631.1 SGNH/GDSL hydrolase family protein [Variovorax sp.]
MHTRWIKTSVAWLLAWQMAGAAAPAAAQPPAPAQAQWATSWMAAPEPTWGPDYVLPLGMPETLRDVTLRQSLRLAVGGDRLRLVLSNVHGAQPLRLGRVQVAAEAGGRFLPVKFGGTDGTVIAAGAQALSDPIDLPVPDGARLRVDIHLPEATRPAGFHWDARERALLLPGDAVGQAEAQGSVALDSRAFLAAVMVLAQNAPSTVVTLGDSITDGNGSTPGTDSRWPDFLARRLAPRGVSVLNAGISGNRLLRDGMGESALARLQRDVLQHPGVRAVIVMLGTNDIGWPGGPFAPDEAPPSLDELTQGMRQLVEQAHLHGVRVTGATVTPFEDALKGTPLEGHYSPAKEALRQAFNRWIRESGTFDAVVDFDRLLRDPQRPARLLARFDSGDHLHPGDAGYEAMAEAIDLRALQ